MKYYIGNCINPPFARPTMELIIDRAKKISKARFIECCQVEELRKKDMTRYPQDYEFYFHKSTGTMFFVHSAIEYFYQ